MQAVPLKGRDAEIATLRAKLSIARIRADRGATRAIRASETVARDRYMERLRAMGESC